jgi:hypothetical protein
MAIGPGIVKVLIWLRQTGHLQTRRGDNSVVLVRIALGLRLNHSHQMTMAARVTAAAKLVASLS